MVQQPMRLAVASLKLTAKEPENGWLEHDRFLLGWMAYFQGFPLAVSLRLAVTLFFFFLETVGDFLCEFWCFCLKPNGGAFVGA